MNPLFRLIFATVLAVLAGASEGASIVLETMNGTTVTARIEPDAGDVGKASKVWLGALLQGTLFLRDGETWKPYAGGAFPVALSSLQLAASQVITVVNGIDVAALEGLELYAGYGATQEEMLSTPGKLARLAVIRPIRDTAYGRVQGRLDGSFSAYGWLGIPYAAPPLGEMRWRAPADPAAWSPATRPALQFANACPQSSTQFGPPPPGQPWGSAILTTFGRYTGDEDCLYLNIWSPASGESGLPVLVYVHGGGNRTGWTGVPDYAGARLAAEQKVVVVTLAYRLGAFGWLNHVALRTGDAAGDSGNFGTLDIIKALNFVRNNIAQFGGDPGNVTLGGQSSGGKNTWSLIVSPLAAGLFHKALPLSDGFSGYPPGDAATYATTLLRRIVINDGKASDDAGADAYLASLSTAALRNYLLALPATAIHAAASHSAVNARFVSPYLDGVVLPGSASEAFSGRYLNSVPILSGIANDEGKLFPPGGTTSAKLGAMLSFNPDNPAATPVAISDLLAAAYLPVDRAFVSCADTGYNGYTLSCPSPTTPDSTRGYWSLQVNTLNRYRPLQAQVYAYDFAWARQPEPWKSYVGSAHETDVPFLFGNFGPGLFSFGYSSANRTGREALSGLMRSSLGAFMRSGNPNHSALGVSWLPWSTVTGEPKRLLLNADDNTVSTRMIGNVTTPPTVQ